MLPRASVATGDAFVCRSQKPVPFPPISVGQSPRLRRRSDDVLLPPGKDCRQIYAKRDSSRMDLPMASPTKSDEISLNIISQLTSWHNVVNFQSRPRTAHLAAPSVTF